MNTALINTDQAIAIGAVIASTLTPLAIGVVGYFYNRNINLAKQSEERAQQREDRLHNIQMQISEERINAYYTILEPFALILSQDEEFTKLPEYEQYQGKKRAEVAMILIQSVRYRQASFKVVLYSSDNVVLTHNDLLKTV